MSWSIRVLARAQDDVERIYRWLHQRSPRGAYRWYAAFSESIAQIANNPKTFAIAPEVLPNWNRAIHQTLFKTPRGRRYRILFELQETEVFILRVRGPGQKPIRRRDVPNE